MNSGGKEINRVALTIIIPSWKNASIGLVLLAGDRTGNLLFSSPEG